MLNEVGTLLDVLGHRHELQGRVVKSGNLLVFLHRLLVWSWVNISFALSHTFLSGPAR